MNASTSSQSNGSPEPNKNASNDTSALSPLSDLYIVSPPPRNPGISHSPTRTSLTPPPCSEKINRAIRKTENELDAAVENVHRFLSQGCPDSAGAEGTKKGSSPESEYSRDCLMSPQNLPDFRNVKSPPNMIRSCSPVRSPMDSIIEGVRKSGGMRRRIFEESEEEDDNETDDDFDESTDHPNADTHVELDLSKLQIGANEKIEESASSKDVQDSGDESDDSSVMIVNTKSFKRRVINDEESSVESEANFSAGVQFDTESEESETEKKEVAASDVKDTEQEQPESLLDDAFTGLTLDDAAATTDVSVDDSVSKSLNPTVQTINTQENDEEDDIIFTEGCGCWTMDKETKDLYLPLDSGKWPKIRLPFPTYQKLYQHQRIGIQWMASLHRNAIKGGILADDMGMGKTMQTLVYLGSLMRAETIHNAMIVCPKSVVRNWEREANLIFKDICGTCEIHAITSDVAKAKRMELFTESFCSKFKKPRLVVTTYGLVSSHITELFNVSKNYPDWCWNYVILDEGHEIRNPNTKISKNVRLLCRNPKTRRLLLTGTPIQNNLKELHSLFDWATDGQLLGTSKTFLNKYATPIEEGRQKNASAWEVKKAAEMNQTLQKLLQPYFLQRLKSSEFQDQLPTKKELVVFVALSKKQRSLYQKYLDGGMIKSVLSGETASPLTAIAYLKQLCGHPSLIRNDRDVVVDDRPADILLAESAKLQVLFSLMQRLKRAGHRALIFSQSTKMLDIMERVFDGSFTYLRIDGQSAEKSRQRNVDDFNDKESGIDCMLLSTKAAGVGLTLNGADRAIIYDPSWNPAEDAQAVDRCYRIGQSKNVTVYRMITCGTVEEKMYEKQVHKDGIKRVLLNESVSGSTKRYFDRAELKDLFRLAPADAPCSMLEKFNGSSAVGSSGKPSFLNKDTNVVGVASHDILYSNVAGEVCSDDSGTVDLTASSKTPFSREPFRNNVQKNPVKIIDVSEQENLKPLGRGLNRSRENRENAKSERQDKVLNAANKSVDAESSAVKKSLSKATDYICNGEHAAALDILLRLLENETSIKGGIKLKVHENISIAARELGWL